MKSYITNHLKLIVFMKDLIFFLSNDTIHLELVAPDEGEDNIYHFSHRMSIFV